jgi:hypothetical protein
MPRNDEEDDLYDTVVRMADRMGLKGPKRRKYIDDHMTQGGYEQDEPTYRKAQDDEDDEGGGGWFGSGRSRGGQQRGSGGRGRGSRDSDDLF